jgi:hypothetical protein
MIEDKREGLVGASGFPPLTSWIPTRRSSAFLADAFIPIHVELARANPRSRAGSLEKVQDTGQGTPWSAGG